MDEQTGGMSRRRALAGAVWTAPAILIATAVPARAASGDNPTPANVMVIYNFTVSDGSNGTVETNTNFGTNWSSGFPATLGPITMFYQVTVTGPTTITTSVQSKVIPAANPASTGTIEYFIEDVPPGDYSAEITVWAEAYDPVGDVTYQGTPISQASQPPTITVT